MNETNETSLKSPPLSRKTSSASNTLEETCDVCCKRGAYYIKGCGHKLCTNCGDEDSLVCLVCGEECEVNKLISSADIIDKTSSSGHNTPPTGGSVVLSGGNSSAISSMSGGSNLVNTTASGESSSSVNKQPKNSNTAITSSSSNEKHHSQHTQVLHNPPPALEPDKLYSSIRKQIQDTINMLELREMQKRKALENRYLDDIDALRNENLQLKEKITKVTSQKDSIEKKYHLEFIQWENRRKQLQDRINELSSATTKVAHIPRLNLNFPLKISPGNVNEDNPSSRDDFEVNMPSSVSSSSASGSSQTITSSISYATANDDSVVNYDGGNNQQELIVILIAQQGNWQLTKEDLQNSGELVIGFFFQK